MEKDTAIFKLINLEKKRQQHGIELIASENFVSKQVMQAMGSCLTINMRKVIRENVITADANLSTRLNNSPSTAPKHYSTLHG